MNDKSISVSHAIQEDISTSSDEQISIADTLSCGSSHVLDSDQMPSDVSIMSSSIETPDDPNDSSYKDEENDNTSESHSIINSEDYTFNINNAYELDYSSVQNMNDDSNEETTDTIDTPSLNSTSSISDMDVPISQLTNDQSAVPSTDSSDTESTLMMNSIQMFQIQNSYEKAVHIMFTQMPAHKGIKLFGQKAIAVMMKELKQLNDGVIPGNPVIKPIPFEELTAKDKKESLEAVNIIAQKKIRKN